ncbi:winged helix-turn-helix transcriptional regulator [Inconstantimicrobium porci]|uniref:winged helix-turn-helix transcriptional regulator n=1 Tax=Inconstantimicrobium porci TaxID=2652291 RepID=UPI002409CC29|nr:helix-turn-helix domain-containing protein [Inconstantimicrobium porci]MDD6770758.1 helix-turn-helix domain-containing protein [Inconstantimicrobium porci]
MRDINEMPSCLIATFTMIMGNKWKLMIIRDLLNQETCFGELKRDLDGISHKVLTENLRSLESDGIVKRNAYNEGNVRRVAYSMTEFGMTLEKIYRDIADWGNAYKDFLKAQKS